MRRDYFYRVKVVVGRVRPHGGCYVGSWTLAPYAFIVHEMPSVGCWCLLAVGLMLPVGCWLLCSVACWLLAFLVLCCTSVALAPKEFRAPFGVTVRVEINGTARATMSLIAVRSNVRAVPYLSAGNTRQPLMRMKF